MKQIFISRHWEHWLLKGHRVLSCELSWAFSVSLALLDLLCLILTSSLYCNCAVSDNLSLFFSLPLIVYLELPLHYCCFVRQNFFIEIDDYSKPYCKIFEFFTSSGAVNLKDLFSYPIIKKNEIGTSPLLWYGLLRYPDYGLFAAFFGLLKN